MSAQPGAVLHQRQHQSAVCGKARIEEAKITGITPPALTFSGMCVDWPPITRRPDHALGVLHRNAPLAALDQDDERHHRDHHHQDHDQRDRAPLMRDEDVLVDVVDGARQDRPRCR